MTWKIMGRYRGRTEELDSADSEKEARCLAGEYSMAFGPDWTVWVTQ